MTGTIDLRLWTASTGTSTSITNDWVFPLTDATWSWTQSTADYWTIAGLQHAKQSILRSITPPVQVQAPPRPPAEFNRYVNSSDLLQEFLSYLASEGVKRDQLQLPLGLFVKWLVIRAAEADGEEPQVTLAIPARARCLGCRRFIRRSPVPFDSPRCAERYFARLAA